MSKDNLIKILKWVWVILVLAGATYYLATHTEQLLSYIQQIQPDYLALSFVFIVISKLFNVFPTIDSVKAQGWQMKYKQAFSVVSLTQLGKYLPGGIWHFVGRISIYKTNNLSNKETGKAILLENIWLLSGALFIGLIGLVMIPDINLLTGQFNLMIPVGINGFLIPVFLVLWLAVLYFSDYFLSSNPAPTLSRLLEKVKLCLIQFAIWASFGISFAFLFPSLNEKTLLLSISGFALSWVAGYVVIFAPGGIGVRELVLVAIFTPFFPVEKIAILSAVHRLVWILVEIAMGIISVLISGSTLEEMNRSE